MRHQPPQYVQLPIQMSAGRTTRPSVPLQAWWWWLLVIIGFAALAAYQAFR